MGHPKIELLAINGVATFVCHIYFIYIYIYIILILYGAYLHLWSQHNPELADNLNEGHLYLHQSKSHSNTASWTMPKGHVSTRMTLGLLFKSEPKNSRPTNGPKMVSSALNIATTSILGWSAIFEKKRDSLGNMWDKRFIYYKKGLRRNFIAVNMMYRCVGRTDLKIQNRSHYISQWSCDVITQYIPIFNYIVYSYFWYSRGNETNVINIA